MGVKRLSVLPLNATAVKSLPVVQSATSITVVEVDSVDGFDLVVGHLSASIDLGEWRPLLALPAIPCTKFMISSTVPVATWQKVGIIPNTVRTSTLRHGRLGGLTSSRMHMAAWGGRKGECPPLHTRVSPLRPIGAFLEPSAPLLQWSLREDGVPATALRWDPSSGQTCPWPPRCRIIWVYTSTVFLGKTSVWRPLSPKELSQLMDIREDWFGKMATVSMRADEGWPVPVRFLLEAVCAAGGWLMDSPTQEKQVAEISSRKVLCDFVYFGWTRESTDEVEVSVATRADDAEWDASLWAVGGEGDGLEEARETIRRGLHRWYCRRVLTSALRWLRGRVQESRDVIAICDVLHRTTSSSWFDWSDGSRLLFWRWPVAWQDEARDGTQACLVRIPPPRPVARKVPVDEEWMQVAVEKKLEKLILRRYVRVPEIRPRVATPFFAVAKGPVDICVVWSGTENGVNPSVWTPHFWLPTMGTLCRRIADNDYLEDFDVAEHFHNFMLHWSIQPFHGVNMPAELVGRMKQTKDTAVDSFMQAERCPFGFTSSPYFANRMTARGVELAMGDVSKPSNPFYFTAVRLNLPGHADYQPHKVWVCKVRPDGSTAAYVVMYFDDGRIIAGTQAECSAALRQICSKLQWLGIQDAARKRRPVSQQPGAWAGGVVFTDRKKARKFLAQSKWDRMKDSIRWIHEHLGDEGGIPSKELTRHRGFLVHASLTYKFMQPYLKGIHLTVDGWRSDRDKDGWKQVHHHEDDPDQAPVEFDLSMPSKVAPVPRLTHDLAAMLKLTSSPTPIMIQLRPVVEGPLKVVYGFGDASGEGFGSYIADRQGLARMRRGFWCSDISEQSSNYRELRNLVEAIRVEVETDRLYGREVFLFTDNSVAENAYANGTSTSMPLFGLVLDIRNLSLNGNFRLHVVHIAGTRMIAQGTDGLSRGEIHLGSLLDAGANTVPLHLSPTNRSESMFDWIRSWAPEARLAEPADWCHNCHVDPSVWIWDLPPAAAAFALEELALARLKRRDTLKAVVVVPMLFRPAWFRQFSRIVDVFFVVRPSHSFWSSAMHEPVVVGICLPLLRYEPWDWKRSPALVAFGRKMSAMHTQSDHKAGDILRKFWALDDDDSVLEVEGDESRFLHARPGDQLMCPFECDNCSFYRLRRCHPDEGLEADMMLLRYLRRANLDAFWSRESSTVSANLRDALKQICLGTMFGIHMFPPLGPFPDVYNPGTSAAIALLYDTTRPGKHEETMKFSSARRARSTHTNIYMASPVNAEALVLRADKTRQVVSRNPTDSEWFSRFVSGCRARLGERVKQDLAMPISVLLKIQDSLEIRWHAASLPEQRRRLAELAVFLLVTFSASLRGFETMKIVLTTLKNGIVDDAAAAAANTPPHMVVPMTGRFKARSNVVQNLILFIVPVTASGLRPMIWTQRLIDELEKVGITGGWLFQQANGKQRKLASFAKDFFSIIQDVQDDFPALLPNVVVTEDFGLARSLRRGATTQATNQKVAESDIDWINRWNTGDSDQTTGIPMRQLYTDRRQILTTYLRFSAAL